MRILILDDSKAYGDLLANACKTLGHTSFVTQNADDALRRILHDTFDAALVDLEMPNIDGTVFIAIAREQGVTLPIAVCTGSCGDEVLANKARELGPLLPMIWTHADLCSLLDALQLEHVKTSEESRPTLDQINKMQRTANTFSEETFNTYVPPDAEALAAGTGSTLKQDQNTITPTRPDANAIAASLPAHVPSSKPTRARRTTTSQVRGSAPKIQVRCSDWAQVRKLCMDARDGRTVLSMHVQGNLSYGQTVMLSLELPDEMAIPIESVIASIGEARPDHARQCQVDLVGLHDKQISFLLARCDDNSATTNNPVQNHERETLPQDPNTEAKLGTQIPESVDSVDLPLDDPYAPVISWD